MFYYFSVFKKLLIKFFTKLEKKIEQNEQNKKTTQEESKKKKERKEMEKIKIEKKAEDRNLEE